MEEGIIVAGNNKNHQLVKQSQDEVILTPIEIPCKLADLSSYSAYSDHSVKVDSSYKAFEIGIPCGYQEPLKNWTQINFSENSYNIFFSAVCGSSYTLYNVLASNPLLILQYDKEKLANFEKNSLYIFGGSQTLATINTDDTILFINTDFDQFYKTLPFEYGMPIQIACLKSSFVILTSKGFLIELDNTDKKSKFNKIIIPNEVFVCVSGTFDHCLAVSKNGDVYSRGQNNHGQLGIGPTEESTTEFKKLETFSEHKIIAAFAGKNHSLFLDEYGGVFACGMGKNGELLIPDLIDEEEGQIEDQYFPVRTCIESGACFCIAGDGLSVVFIGSRQPEKMPNSRTSIFVTKKLIEEMEIAEKRSKEIVQSVVFTKNGKAKKDKEAAKIAREERAKEKELEKQKRAELMERNRKAKEMSAQAYQRVKDIKLLKITELSPDVKTADTKTVDVKTVNTKTVNVNTADTKTVDVKTANVKTVNVKTVNTKTVDVKTANIKNGGLDNDNLKEQIVNELSGISKKLQNQLNNFKLLQKQNSEMLKSVELLLNQIDSLGIKDDAGNEVADKDEEFEDDYEYQYDDD
ncbi:Protein rcc2 [Tritrichomonas musculus]|uniref:Protein rcc2 n=1 Tax=Tritrichomonas musculus TaxID=1915356 RepID=A0ABR2IM13_9EUKA